MLLTILIKYIHEKVNNETMHQIDTGRPVHSQPTTSTATGTTVHFLSTTTLEPTDSDILWQILVYTLSSV